MPSTLGGWHFLFNRLTNHWLGFTSRYTVILRKKKYVKILASYSTTLYLCHCSKFSTLIELLHLHIFLPYTFSLTEFLIDFDLSYPLKAA